MTTTTLYSRLPNLGPDCSTSRSVRLRERRFGMGYEQPVEPPAYTQLAGKAREILLAHETEDPAMARALALRHVVEEAELTPEPDTVLLGGENPFFFNLLLPALQADRYSHERQSLVDPESDGLRVARVILASCFEGHITPGVEFILGQGIVGIRRRIEEELHSRCASGDLDKEQEQFYRAALFSCETVLIYARRYRQAAEQLATATPDGDYAVELRRAAAVLSRVPEHPARTLHEALQAFWLIYILITVEMGGCMPGGGIGLGRLDQVLYPYYQRDLAQGRLDRAQALELIECFLLTFRHEDYYTPHQQFTPGSQASLGGITPTGLSAANAMTELLMEASLRIAMPAPYLSVRLYQEAPEPYWELAANYILGGLGFPVVNDEVLIPAMLRHGRTLSDARDYICSCCYEHTLPGREAFHPNGCYLNLPLVLELALNSGRSLLSGAQLGCATPDAATFTSFDAVLGTFRQQLHYVCEGMVRLVNAADRAHMRYRRYPLMSLFMDDCLARGQDVCAGGARYNLTGCIVAGLPNVVNALAAIRECVFRRQELRMDDLVAALRTDFVSAEDLRRRLLAAPKWGNGDERVDDLANGIAEMLYAELAARRNPRGGRWQLALYSFVANIQLGQAVGASADGRMARTLLTRNLNPTWGTDREGPTAVLRSLGHIDFTQAPDGSALDLRFDPTLSQTSEGRAAFVAFLKAFVNLGLMEMQLSFVDTATLRAAQCHPEHYPNLMVRVAGYSARFIDLPQHEQEEIIGRTAHSG